MGDFNITGPTCLTTIDWSNSHHKMSIAASLVEGIYTLEHDRQENRQGDQALAPPWWEFFNFKLDKELKDNHDLSYFGGVYKFNFPYHNNLGQRPPHYVVAFRGTIFEPKSIEQDLKLNFHCIINNIKTRPRFQVGLESVDDIVREVGAENVWLAGHSLGSSIALVIGREMVKAGIHLETYLFNPPFPSPPIGCIIKNEEVKSVLRIAKSFLTAFLATVTDSQENESFVTLSSWIPYLFINQDDPICSGYDVYFKHREEMESIGAGELGRLATKQSIRVIFGGEDSEAVHLVPSAYLSTYKSFKEANGIDQLWRSLKEAHGIHQWWRQDLELECKLYEYK